MEKNNGKIAIAIVAMFVVALSIVGITYAYFTATITDNKTETVEVSSGVLRVAYSAGDTIDTAATNTVVVPGWANDGDKFYDVELSNDNGNIAATSLASLDEADRATYENRVVQPLHFSVQDQSTEGKTAYYGIRLKSITNTVADSNGDGELTTYQTTDTPAVTVDEAAESKRVKFWLYTDESLENLADGCPETGFELGITNGKEVSAPISITNGATNHYYAVVEYENDPAAAQNFAQGKQISVTVEIVGLNDIDGVYKTASGAAWSLTA